ncbi:MAG: DNA adenine methylase, partial [Thermomicrobiales bacterium]
MALNGGKYYLAKRIIDLMPAHTHYVEPYAGSLAVLLAKDPEGVSEVANDIHNHLTNFWRVLISPSGFEHLQRLFEATPFCEKLWRLSLERLRTPCGASGDELCPPCAFAFFICCRQSMA